MANVHGLGSLKNDDDAAKPKPDDDGQAFYVGGNSNQGGGGSGLSVLDPNDPGNGGNGGNAGAMNKVFSQAKAQASGAADVPPPAPDGSSGPKRTVTVYRNGFTVDNGPFRALDDPANASFLNDMAHGVVPRELEEGVTGHVNVDLVDKRGEDYEKPPEPTYVAFAGEGQTMGGDSKVEAGALVGGDAAPAADEKPVVDESAPKTTIMVRLHDGKRIKVTVNLTHTVRHVQALIAAEGAGSAPYVLMAGFPPAQLSDASQTIEAAGLKGAQITQKLA